MNYKVGDRVRLRKECEAGNYYGGLRLSQNTIEAMQGKILEIVSCSENNANFRFKDYDGHRLTSEMIEPIGDDFIRPLF